MSINLPVEAWEDIVKALRSSDNMTNEGLANMIEERAKKALTNSEKGVNHG